MKVPKLFDKGETASEEVMTEEDQFKSELQSSEANVQETKNEDFVASRDSLNQTVSANKDSLDDTNIEALWFELQKQPNDDKHLRLLMRYCMKQQGDKAVDAALEALAEEPGSFLPKLLLATRALERKSIVIATSYYQDILDKGHTSDDVLLRISADLGRYGYPDKMIRLVLPHYDADAHSEYIGLNLLQASKETKNYSVGRDLVHKLKKRDRIDHAKALEKFALHFDFDQGDCTSSEDMNTSVMEQSSTDQDTESKNERIANTVESQAPQKIDSNTDDENAESEVSDRPVMMCLPAWRAFIPVLDDLLPDPEKVSRVGILVYSDATDYSQMQKFPGVEMMQSLSLGLPLLIGEHLLFSAPVQPRVLVPVQYSAGPYLGASEPDVQKLFSLCAKESLDFLITGTMTQSVENSTVRSWLLDRSKKTARILSKTATLENWPQAIVDHAKELNQIFADKSYAFELKRKGLVYSAPHKNTVLMQTSGLYHLALRALFADDFCDGAVLCDASKLLLILADLCHAKPLSQNFLMMLLAGMIADQKMGGDAYMQYRTFLYQTAQKMQYTPCVTKCKKAFDSVLLQR